MQEPTLITIKDKLLIGQHITVSVARYDVSLLWRTFMPRQKQLEHKVSNDLYSISVYPVGYFQAFDPTTTFEKWAAVEVPEGTVVPEGLSEFILPGGLYAVFQHKGDAQAFAQLLQYIYEVWIQRSGYALDDRPHFECLGAAYKNNDPASEEAVWIPVRGL